MTSHSSSGHSGLTRISKITIKLLVMLIFAFAAYGVAGMGVILAMYALSFVALGRDSEASHGISNRESSRLGGLAIGIIFAVFILVMFLLSPYTPGVARDPLHIYLWSAVAACCLLGLSEDIAPDLLSPMLRLILKMSVFGLLLWVAPAMVPKQIGILGIDTLLGMPLLGWLLATLFCVGFINAVNMADGANGLIPGIVLATMIMFFLVYGRPAEGVLVFACAMFLIFNVISGWYFLGDMGSYGLGAIVACYGLLGVAQGDFSAGLMASFVAYPSIDFIYSILRRLKAGRSPLAADDGHLHNRLHRFYAPYFRSKVLPNSLTGLSISGATAGLSLLVFLNGWLPVESNLWFVVFGFEVLMYVLVIRLLTTHQYCNP